MQGTPPNTTSANTATPVVATPNVDAPPAQNTKRKRGQGRATNAKGSEKKEGPVTTTQRIDSANHSGPGRLTLGQTIDQQILQAVTGNHSERALRLKFTKMALSSTGAVGVCFLKKGAHELWTPAIDAPSAGRLPAREEFTEAFAERCDQVIKSTNVQTEKFDALGMHALLAPVRPRGGAAEIVLLVVSSQQQLITQTRNLQTMASSLKLFLDSQNAADANWQVMALATILELVGKIEQQTTIKAATEEAVNQLANRIGCSTAVIGLIERGQMQLKAISGIAKVDFGSASSQNYLQTLVESSVRGEAGTYPATDPQNNHMLQAHRQLAAITHAEAVFSHPLLDDEGEAVGAIVLTGSKALMEASQTQRFVGTAAPSITNTLQIVRKVKTNAITRTTRYIKSKTSTTKRVVLVMCMICFIALMFLPITYRVRCYCVAEPVNRRFAVAPFDGQIIVGHKEAGDFVKAGDVLAEMDGRTIRWELSGVIAEREQSLRTREMELSERNVPKTILAELEHDRLASEESVLQYKRDHLQIKSPIDGVVLSGSLERAEAASVETGKVLFEIGPLKPMRVEIAVPSDEIAQVKVGFPAKVWIDGQEDEPITGTIRKIHPRSETRDALNVFIAEVEFANEDERLRPGMKGSVRLDCEKRTLGWSLFHKPMNYIRSELTWW